jgi:cGMP-dependent protein kinase
VSLSICRSFLKLIGQLEALKRDYGDERRERPSLSHIEPPSPTKTVVEKEYANIQLKDLKRLATLGVGGFGRVELVCALGDKARTFALKALKKKHIVDTRQQEHIFAERNIMMETRCEWIVRYCKREKVRIYSCKNLGFSCLPYSSQSINILQIIFDLS